MKVIILMIAAVCLLASCNSADKNTDSSNGKGQQQEISMENLVEVTIDVNGMTCEGCENAVKKSIGSLAGISAVNASHVDSVAEVIYDKTQTSLEEIEIKISDAGYIVVKD